MQQAEASYLIQRNPMSFDLLSNITKNILYTYCKPVTIYWTAQ